MAGQRLVFASVLSRIVLGCAFIIVARPVCAQPTQEEIPRTWLTDVELTDVFFFNEQMGWAVGEHGTILKTTDGGTNWSHTANLKQVAEKDLALTADMAKVLGQMRRRIGDNAAPRTRAVPTGINFRFESVHFADENNGLVVGGYDIPYVDRSRAVVMKTTDGGLSWKVIQGLVIPRLAKVHMDNPFDVQAFGASGNLFPLGFYQSTNGGKSWSSQSSNKGRVDFLDADQTADSVVAVDSQGEIQVVTEDSSTLATVNSKSKAPIRAVEMLSLIHI